MRYTITSQQLSFFQKEEHIELEELFTKEEAEDLKSLLEEAFAKRGAKSSKNKLEEGHDLQRDNPAIYKALKPKRLGQIATQLFNKKRLRIAFTEYYPAYNDTFSARDISSYTETVGCMLMNLSVELMGLNFYSANFPIDFHDLDLPVLLVVFATDQSRYQQKEKDPHKNAPKKLGYGAGDRITSDTHPLIS